MTYIILTKSLRHDMLVMTTLNIIDVNIAFDFDFDFPYYTKAKFNKM